MKKILNNYEREEKNRLYRGYIMEYNRCLKTMEDAARNGRQYCTFGVSVENTYFIDWDFKRAIEIIIEKLREEGITVLLKKPNLLLINWKKFKIDSNETIEQTKKYWQEIEKTNEFIKKMENNEEESSDDET